MADDATEKSPNPRNMRPIPRPSDPASRKMAATKPEAMDTTGLGRVVVRNEFYRDGYRLALRVALIQCFIIFGLIGAMYFVIHVHQPENRYFATTEDGRLIPMVPLNQPNLSTPALLSWVAQAASETMSFSFSNYRRNLQQASRNFTRSGWESFSTALQQARIIESIEANTQEVTAVPRGAPVLKSEGLAGGQYQWVVQIPLLLTYVSGSKTRSEGWIVTLVVVRVPRLESPNGVGIAQWIAVPG
jgi:intracellular multiplication protein IcmL